MPKNISQGQIPHPWVSLMKCTQTQFCSRRMQHARLGCRDPCVLTLKLYWFLPFSFLFFFSTILVPQRILSDQQERAYGRRDHASADFPCGPAFCDQDGLLGITLHVFSSLLSLQIKPHVQNYICNMWAIRRQAVGLVTIKIVAIDKWSPLSCLAHLPRQNLGSKERRNSTSG